jgi:hypothetical protein
MDESVIKFMDDYFKARILEEKEYQSRRIPFRSKFFSPECRFDSHVDTIARFMSEKVLSVESEENEVYVVTEQEFRYSGGIQKMRHKFTLQPYEVSWRIREVKVIYPVPPFSVEQ